MKLILEDYETITIEADEIDYIVYKDNIGIVIRRKDDELLKITDVTSLNETLTKNVIVE